ncbi:MAG: hypothetical protein LBJ40_20920 [Delftia acidovorans]|jgi:hypothetical protein|nr:hypothetical protein [Delftia acidovorans]MDR3019236.1 hypothetical protein [Delftia acidovorans]
MQPFILHASKQAIKVFGITGNTNIRHGEYVCNGAPWPVIPDEAAPGGLFPGRPSDLEHST